jgi:PA14 domain
MKYALVLIALTLVSCAGTSGSNGAQGAPGAMGQAGPAGQVTVLPPDLDTISDVIQEYNENRVAQGQDSVESGLACTLYTVPNTTTQIVGATLTTVGSWTYTGLSDGSMFNQPNGPSSPGINVLPSPLQGIYTAYYLIKCTGVYVVPESGWYEFDLASDDGANLYINGLLINNDGVHGITEKSATKFFSRGVASFELDFFDAGGDHALMLMSSGVLVPAVNFYH